MAEDAERVPLLDEDEPSIKESEVSTNYPQVDPINLKSHQTLGSLESFWNVLWMLFVETSILAVFLFVEFVLSYHRLDHELYILLIVPPVINLIASLIVFLSPRGSVFANAFYALILVASVIINIVGLFLLMNDFASEVHEADCEEREMKHWGPISVKILYLTLNVWGFSHRIYASYLSAQLTRAPHVIYEKFAHKPHHPRLETFLSGLSKVITYCCMPASCRKEMLSDPKTQHNVHHGIQLVYEIILLIVACIEAKNIEIASIVLGLLGSIFGLFHVYRLDMLLNSGAFILATIIFGIDIANIRCTDDVRAFIYILMFSLIANSVRLKSVLHAYIESTEKEHHWMSEQKRWVEVSEPHLLCFTHKYTTRLYKNEISKKDLEGWAVSCIAGSMVIAMLVGFSMIIAFSITLGVLYPQLKGADKLAQFKSWEQKSCYINTYDTEYDFSNDQYLYRVLYAVSVEGSSTAYAAVTFNQIWGGSTSGDYIYALHSVDCRVPSTVMNYTDALDNEKDYFSYNPNFIILEPNNAIAKRVSNYYLLVVGCPAGIVVGVVSFGGVCFLLIRFERQRKQSEARKKLIQAKRAQNKQNKNAAKQ